MIWVVDSADVDRLAICKAELDQLLIEDVKRANISFRYMLMICILLFKNIEIGWCKFVDIRKQTRLERSIDSRRDFKR